LSQNSGSNFEVREMKIWVRSEHSIVMGKTNYPNRTRT
jgi:hypothetical protein